ncbi:alpha-2-macroglobulin-like protein 1 [Electrophorus electricus]|uniref:alpha-2-macroglobulin-like protein 1 n=1 Tax=Electrophorus electricus TaxID=8005 RepID=UPI0015D097FE|nr:alpha-2-macroglobulin-like protein 1 [Electrophorus electricus]
MQLSRVLATTLLLLHSAVIASSNGLTYLLTVNSQPIGGSVETLCVQLYTCRPLLSLVAHLEHRQENKTKALMRVPAVTIDTEASVSLEIKGRFAFVNKITKILIKPPGLLSIIETDKPIYKRGQTVKFRIVSLHSNFLTYNQMFPTIEVKDPNSNRIGQWLNVSTFSGFLDMSYPINPEAAEGFYTITVWNERNEPIIQQFEIKEYVLPKFEVTVELPPVITILDTTVTLKVCAKYTYGKPVIGSATAVVCRKSYRYWWFAPGSAQLSDICRTFKMETGRTGCGSYVIDLSDFVLSDTRYVDIISVDAEVEEYGTGVVMSGSGSISITSDIVTLTFVNADDVFKPGMAYEGEIKVTGPDSTPIINEPVYLIVRYAENKNKTWTLVTDDNGVAAFSLDTHPWGLQTASLEARYHMEEYSFGYVGMLRRPTYPSAYLWLQPFYSKSSSFLELLRPLVAFSDSDAVVVANYIIHSRALEPQQNSLDFFYMVMSRGHTAQQGCITVEVDPEKENRGKLSILLQSPLSLAPVAQVVVYALLANGDVLADNMDFPIELSLMNKVSLELSSSEELPGLNIFLTLKAHPGSLCSVRAIDESLLLLRPEKEFTIQSVYNMLPIQMLSGYPYGTEDEDPNMCIFRPPIMEPFVNPRSRLPVLPILLGKVNVYNVFKYAGIKIISNAYIKKKEVCRPTGPVPTFDLLLMSSSVAADAGQMQDSGQSQPASSVRKYFPETWIWDLVLVGESGAMEVSKTVPDTITTWEAGAFCTSPVGFGVAPKVNLTAFQPFFVSLTLPYSIVRGEVFTLKATVFNYLPSCIMVKVTLAQSQQFSAQSCVGCVYTHCLCADESWTFMWVITPSVLGEVIIRVSAEAVHSSVLCGNGIPTVPEKGSLDTVEQTLLVVAEGTKQTNSYNEFMCTRGGAVDQTVTLTLPEVFVEGSATAYVSVLGDLMGRALQNLDNLLAMPYGCGEQNMLLFAPDIFILGYLESSGQLTPAIRSKATSFLLSGYQRELSFKHFDGSYSAFGMSDSSGNTWLTAFVMKSFESAKQYIFIDQTVIDQAKTWLGNEQQPNGCFASVGNLIHVDMQGGVNDNVTLSAYITAALLEAGNQSTDPIVAKSLEYLRNAHAKTNSTYAIALLSYTFTLAGDQVMRGTLLSRLNQLAIVTVDGRHWSSGSQGMGTNPLDVEMTAYVLLALLSGPPLASFDLGYSASIVHWLGQQQNSYGGFISTQDTVVALQALAKYSSITYSPTGTIAVTVMSTHGLKTQLTVAQFTVNQSNRLLYQQAKLQQVSGVYKVRASGQGCVFVQFTMYYNIPPPNDFSSFDISTSEVGNCSDPIPSLEISVTVIYNGANEVSTMVVIEFKLLSGFSLVKVMLQCGLFLQVNGTVKRVDKNDDVVIIYLDGLKKGERQTYTLIIQQDVVVQNLMPAVVKVYDYYKPSDAVVTEYISPCN